MNYLEMKNVRKSFGNLEVLKGIDLAVSEGEVVSIIGPSGSGKTTLLRIATFLENMDGGEMSYLGGKAVREENGRSVYASHKEIREYRMNFGLVFQKFTCKGKLQGCKKWCI